MEEEAPDALEVAEKTNARGKKKAQDEQRARKVILFYLDIFLIIAIFIRDADFRSLKRWY